MTKEKNNISISINSTYLQQESDPKNSKFYFLYTVSIINNGSIGGFSSSSGINLKKKLLEFEKSF